MKTLICIPCMDMVHTMFLRSILSLQATGDVRFALSASSLVYDARNTLARQAIEEKYDRVLWLDSDMDFEPDLMQRLAADLDEGREFVASLYMTRKAPIKPTIFEKCGYVHDEAGGAIRNIATSFYDYPKDQVFEIEAAGFGGVMMTVDLLRRVTEKYGLPFAPMLGFGEDMSFCLRARELGAKLYCDSRVKMGHVGMGVISEETYEGIRKNAGSNTVEQS